jgi:hypothetical protein
LFTGDQEIRRFLDRRTREKETKKQEKRRSGVPLRYERNA